MDCLAGIASLVKHTFCISLVSHDEERVSAGVNTYFGRATIGEGLSSKCHDVREEVRGR